jgi:hypothetical protein
MRHVTTLLVTKRTIYMASSVASVPGKWYHNGRELLGAAQKSVNAKNLLSEIMTALAMQLSIQMYLHLRPLSWRPQISERHQVLVLRLQA